MDRRIDSLFITMVLECPTQSKFHLPQLKLFDGLKDPLDHLNTFKNNSRSSTAPWRNTMLFFPYHPQKSCEGVVYEVTNAIHRQLWQLHNSFLCHFVRGQRPRRPADHLLTIKQGEKETLRSYVKRFTRETLEVDEADDKVQLSTFKASLKFREFVVSLAKNPP